MILSRAYQDEGVASIYNYYGSGKTGNPVVAMPTASGKSVVIGKFLRSVFAQWPNQRVIVATHVKELIEQNYNKLMEVWPNAPAGIYSAGLGQRDIQRPIIFGGVQSIVNCINKFGWRDLLLVDECHLISGKENSNYGKVIAALRSINPALKVIGFTATRYRLGQGLITDGPVFTDCCFDLTEMHSFNRLIDEGYLCPLIPKRTGTELNVSDVAIQNGDYVKAALQHAVDKDAITYAACKEIMEYGQNRRSWLIFASGVEHSDHVAAMLQSFGISARSVHSKISDDERDEILRDFKSGELRCVVNNNVLTTGFDHPAMDLIGMLRPTVSTGLWVQMLGRGTRPSPDTFKQNCLVLDFAGNTKRLGPINDPVIPKKRGLKDGGVAPIKICDKCGTYNHTRAVVCIGCGAKFEAAPKITKHASSEELIKTSAPPQVETFDVRNVTYAKHHKAGSTPVIKVTYFTKNMLQKPFFEYVAIEHTGYARKQAVNWWRQRLYIDPPNSVDEALKYVAQLKVPKQLRVWTNKQYPEVLATVF